MSLGHDYIGTEHLLLGIVHENDGVAARVLRDLGVNSGDIVEDLRSRAGEGPVPEQRRYPDYGTLERLLEFVTTARGLPGTDTVDDQAGPTDWEGSDGVLGEAVLVPAVPGEATRRVVRARFADGGQAETTIAL